MSELKPRSFRIDDETLKKFQEISQKISGNQQEVLAKLIESYEFQSGKAVLIDRKKDIEDFENYVTAITRMYMASLEDYENRTETVRVEFDAQLKSKETTIKDLQNEREKLKLEHDQALSTRTSLESQISQLNNKIKNDYEVRLADIQKTLTDNESYIVLLKEKNQTLEQKAENFEVLQTENEAARIKIAELEKQLDTQSMEHQKAILELEKKHMSEISALEVAHRTEFTKYQQYFQSVLDKQFTEQKQAEQKQKRTAKKSTAKKSASETTVTENKAES